MQNVIGPIKAYFLLGVKAMSKDWLGFVWGLTFPGISLFLRAHSMDAAQYVDLSMYVLGLRFLWAFVIINAYLFGIGFNAAELRESGNLRTYFSIRPAKVQFFIAKLLTQVVFVLLCLTIFNAAAAAVIGRGFIYMMGRTLFMVAASLPFAFLAAGVTLVRKVFLNSLRTLVSIATALLTVLAMGTFGDFNVLAFVNPVSFVGETLTMRYANDFVYWGVVSLLFVVVGVLSVWRFTPISKEVR